MPASAALEMGCAVWCTNSRSSLERVQGGKIHGGQGKPDSLLHSLLLSGSISPQHKRNSSHTHICSPAVTRTSVDSEPTWTPSSTPNAEISWRGSWEEGSGKDEVTDFEQSPSIILFILKLVSCRSFTDIAYSLETINYILIEPGLEHSAIQSVD